MCIYVGERKKTSWVLDSYSVLTADSVWKISEESHRDPIRDTLTFCWGCTAGTQCTDTDPFLIASGKGLPSCTYIYTAQYSSAAVHWPQLFLNFPLKKSSVPDEAKLHLSLSSSCTYVRSLSHQKGKRLLIHFLFWQQTYDGSNSHTISLLSLSPVPCAPPSPRLATVTKIKRCRLLNCLKGTDWSGLAVVNKLPSW